MGLADQRHAWIDAPPVAQAVRRLLKEAEDPSRPLTFHVPICRHAMARWVFNPLWRTRPFAIIGRMVEAIDRWENEGGATRPMYPPQPLLSERDDKELATARYGTSDRATPADSAQRPSAQHRSHPSQPG